MPTFQATNDFNCPYCNEMLNGASGFSKQDKPQDGHFTICTFCVEVCVYVIDGNGIITLRKVEEADQEYINGNGPLAQEIKMLQDFVRNKPK